MAQKFLSIKNFEKYQHFKKAMPPWIKLYRSMFGDRDFMSLTISSRYLYIGLIMLASEGCNRVSNDPPWIAQRLSISPSDIDLRPLYQRGLLIASESSVRRYSEESEKRQRREETETEERRPVPVRVIEGFERFWDLYPRKKSKGDAERAWSRLKPDDLLQARIIDALGMAKASDDWTRDGGKYIPYPASWLNKRGWEDDHRPVVDVWAS